MKLLCDVIMCLALMLLMLAGAYLLLSRMANEQGRYGMKYEAEYEVCLQGERR